MAYYPKNINERILHRLKIAQGHLSKVLRMTADKNYCIDILHQSNAVQRALKEADNLIMGNHLNTCASDAIQKGQKDKAIKEVMSVFEKI